MAIVTILVVEDEMIIAKDIQKKLENLGYTVPAVVSTGEEAVNKAAEFHPDLVLVDIKLRGEMDGIEAAEQIRTRFNIPAVYLTAYADEKTLQRAKITGPYGYIMKPFELRGLHGTIEMALYNHRIETKLRESEQRFRNLVEDSLCGIFIIQDDQMVFHNAEHERLFGSLPQSFKLIDFEGIHPDDVERVKQFYQGITSGEVRTLDTDFRFYPLGKMNNKPNMKWVYCRASVIEYQGRKAIFFNMMDVTRAKELEHLLGIQDKMTSLGHVAAGIAHEIRNPLSGINIYLNTLEKIYDKAGSSQKVEAILGQLQSASNKIESVIKRVMDFSKPSEPEFALVDINQPIEEAINLSSVTLRKRGIKIEKALDKHLPPCYADAHLVEQVILNLITNAAEAMKNVAGAKKIEVTSSKENNRILVRVSDSGPGVPLNLRDKIFDPFYTTKNGSTGIGLSISHRIIADHGGSLSLSKSERGGAEFLIEIPIEKEMEQR